MTERIVIEGTGLTVVEQPTLFDRPTVNVKRKRPPEYIPKAPTDGIDLVALNRQLGDDNPYWSDEANDWADAHPEVRPKDAAKRWRKHRIEPAQEAA